MRHIQRLYPFRVCLDAAITSEQKAYLLLTLTAACWGTNVVLGQLAVGHVSPMMLVFCRWIGVLSLLMVFARKYAITDWPILKTRLFYLFAMGALGFTAFNIMFYTAAKSTVGLNIGILQGSIPVLVLIGSYVMFKTPVNFKQIIGIVVTMIGIACLVTKGDLSVLSEFAFNNGDLLMLFACVFYSGYTVMLRQKPASSSMGFFTMLAAAALIASIPPAIYEYSYGDFIWPTPQGWVVVVIATLLPSFAAQVMFIKGVELIGAPRAGVFANLVPIFGALFVILILNESIEFYHIISLALVLAGIWVSERGKQ